MEYIHDDYLDERLKGRCPHCGGSVDTSTDSSDHMPSKTLLRPPYPDNLPVVPACVDCNTSHSRDEEYLSIFLESVVAGSTDAEFACNPRIARALKRSPKLKARIDSARTEYKNLFGEVSITWEPEMERVRRVVLKNACGHAYYEFGETMFDDPEYIRALPLVSMTQTQREEFENDGGIFDKFPELGSRMMTRIMTGQDMDDAWIIVQDDVYRYSVTRMGGGVRVRSVLLEYLAADVYWA